MNDDIMYCCGNWRRHWHVYYCYADDDTLLYVGQSSELSWRLYHHSRITGSWWSWFPYCATVTVSRGLTSRSEARQLESAEIARLRPVFNLHHNPEPTPWVAPEQCPRPYGAMPKVAWPPREQKTA